LITLENLTFAYNIFGQKQPPILSGINLTVQRGQFLAIVGLSGSGKTTLMQHFTGLLTPDAGKTLVDGQDIHKDYPDIAALRRRISLVFQFPEKQLFAETVFEDVAFGPRNVFPSERIQDKVINALSAVGLEPKLFADRSPMSLSEGEKRRVALAGTIAMEPECLILDEPTAGLDQKGISTMMDFMKNFHANQKTVVVITHNMNLVENLADKIALLEKGKVTFQGGKKMFKEKAPQVSRAFLSRQFHFNNFMDS